ncbi:hypothetical protein M413DRAFT_403221 [Hebeloma cylindrosporum]|uniref:Uncharacterized protein n=1 Tax=Hebeloma cylindrosporum TaxID=76867 RepID=A0A0C2Y0I0_HEBCY|nr:hypothetical protein M413DRAFT_403221 [Hebeloma cylindrosporum h7]
MNVSCSFLYHLFLHFVTSSSSLYPDPSLSVYPHSPPHQFLSFFPQVPLPVPGIDKPNPTLVAVLFLVFLPMSLSIPLLNRIRLPREGVPTHRSQ